VTDRLPPNAIDSEGLVLSAVMLDPCALDEVSSLLDPKHFYSAPNQTIYEQVRELAAKGRDYDPTAVAHALQSKGELKRVGGVSYITKTLVEQPPTARITDHARTIVDCWRLRQLISTCTRYQLEGHEHQHDIQAFIEQAEAEIHDLTHTTESRDVVHVRGSVKRAAEAAGEASRNGGQITGTSTGITKLDKMTSGMHGGELYVIAGRPGQGKTSFVLGVLLAVATQQDGAVFFSLEMPEQQLGMRLISMDGRVDVSRVRTGELRREDLSRLTESAERIGKLPFFLDDTPALTLTAIRARARRVKSLFAKEGRKLGVIGVDYLQLMGGSDRAGNREQEVSENSRGLKQLAKELDVPVLALSQLNRSCEQRKGGDKRPQLSDMRESGAVEQDADVVIAIYRDEYYFSEETIDKGIAELIVLKQRNGVTGTVKAKFTQEYTRFDNLAMEEYVEFDEQEFPSTFTPMGEAPAHWTDGL
jgi:replicative DNA helicase